VEVGRLNSLTGSAWLEKEIEELPELVNYWVRVGDLTLLVGASGVGKSSIALPLALSLAGGVPFLGFEVPNPEPVLYLDLEMGEFEFSTRLQTLLPQFPDIARQNFHGISIPSKERTSFKINRESDKLQLLNELKIVRPKLLVIDNHTRFHSGDPNIEKDMSSMILTPFSEMMAEFDLGILYVMHTGWRERERPRGSAAILDAATTEIVVAKKNALRERTLKWEKNRPVRRQQGITKLNVTYDFDTFMVETGELDGISALIQQVVFPIERTELAQRIMEDLNVGRTWAYKQIKNLEERGNVVVDGKLLRLPFDDIGDL
jgi:RecA-family ATPase